MTFAAAAASCSTPTSASSRAGPSGTFVYWAHGADDAATDALQTNAIAIYTSAGNRQLIYDLGAQHPGYAQLRVESILARGRRFVISGRRQSADGALSDRASIFLAAGPDPTRPLLENYPLVPATRLAISPSPGGQNLLIQSCEDEPGACANTRIINLKTGQSTPLDPAGFTSWISDRQLVHLPTALDVKLPGSGASIITLGTPAESTYYQLDRGTADGLRRGDVLAVYARVESNPITGEDESYDPTSLLGCLILVRLEPHRAWALRYSPGDTPLSAGSLVTNGHVKGHLTAVEQRKEIW